MESLKGASSLHEEWEKVKENLKGVDDNIKKLYGRDPSDSSFRPAQRRVSRGDGDGASVGRGSAAGRLFGEARKAMGNPNREPLGRDRVHPVRTVSIEGRSRLANLQSRLGPKRRRDSDDEVDPSLPKPAVQSSVVLQPKDVPKREESLAMRTDKQGMARNRRMFGALLGTLQRFQTDSKKEEDKEKRRAQVEKKLEMKAREEKDQLRQERAALWSERRAKQKELRQLEYKMRIVKMFEAWERQIRKQSNFIKTTKGKPYIFYKPKTMLPANEKAKEATKDFIEGLVKERKEKLEAEISRIMAQPVRRSKKSPERDGRRGEDKSDDDSEDSESDNDETGSESDLEEGEVPSRKRARHESASSLPDPESVKKEKGEKIVKVKEEKMDDDASNQVGSEEQSGKDQSGTEIEGKIRGSKSPEHRLERERQRSVDRSRSQSRSRSKSVERSRAHASPKNKSDEKKKRTADGSGTDSGSDSDSRSGSSSDSGSDSENENNKAKK